MSEGHATWVYAITSDLDSAVLAGIEGIGGEPVRTLADNSLTAVIGSIDADAFGEEAFERMLSDPGQVEVLARAHHRVVEVVAGGSPVLPLRLATVYRNDDRVRALLKQRQARFAETLRWLTGRGECGVKVWADPAALATGRTGGEPAPAAPDPGPAAGGSHRPGHGAGAAYLSRRRAQLEARADGRLRAAQRGEDIHGALTGRAVAARQHPLQDPRLAGNQELMVLNGAYLVDAARMDQFAAYARAAVADLARFRLDITGPWPPYSFADGPDG